MIRIGSIDKILTSIPEQRTEAAEVSKRGLGHSGITAAMREDEAVGYPSAVGADGTYVPTVEPKNVPARELKPGDIGYSSRETGPQVLGQ